MWTSILDAGTPNSQWASMTSSPLFISEALSTVTFLPMLPLGMVQGLAGVTRLQLLQGGIQKRAPGSREDDRLDIFLPVPGHGLEDGAVLAVDGRRRTPCSSDLPIRISPAMTSGSLLAMASVFPALRRRGGQEADAARRGRRRPSPPRDGWLRPQSFQCPKGCGWGEGHDSGRSCRAASGRP